jgi:negative regulator of replication initiation
MEKKKPMKKMKARDSDTHTNIRVSRQTKEMFDACGKYGESADDILRRLISREVDALSKRGRIVRYIEDAKRDPHTVTRIVNAGER